MDWGSKFFEPYEALLARVPFFPSLGNHDGNETERHHDMDVILDNFTFPQNKPARYYDFTYGGRAQFFALDTTSNTESGSARSGYLEGSPQFHWMQSEFGKPHPLWVIPFFHHPMFTAGPEHPSSLEQLRHWFRLFVNSGVKVVFPGTNTTFRRPKSARTPAAFGSSSAEPAASCGWATCKKKHEESAHRGLGRAKSLPGSRH